MNEEQIIERALSSSRAKVHASRGACDFVSKLQAWADSHERVFTAKAEGDSLELVIMDVIGDFFFGGVSALGIKREIDKAPKAKNIHVLLSTPGGDAIDGIAIRALLKRHPATVTIEVLGEAASAGAVILTAGDRVEMHVGSSVMIHRAWTFAVGNAADLEESVATLKSLDEGQLDIFQAHTGGSRDDIRAWLNAETRMGSTLAIERGFAHAMAAESSAPKQTNARRSKTSARLPAFAAMSALAIELPADAAIGDPASDDLAVVVPPEPAVEPPPAPEPTPLETAIRTAAENEPAPGAPPALEPEPNPAPAPPAAQQPNPARPERTPMTDKNTPTNDATPAVARALGLPPGSPESDIVAACTRLRELELNVQAIAGVEQTSQVIGALNGFKSSAQAAEKLQTENLELKAERDEREFETLLAQGLTPPMKLSPKTAEHYRELFTSAKADGRGAEIVGQLKGFLKTASPIVAAPRVQPKGETGGSSGSTWNGKTYAQLTFSQRASLKTENPDLHAQMKRDWEAAGCPEAAA